MIALKNILVATDFGVAAEAALEYGRHIARTYGANLHVLHAASDVPLGFVVDGSMTVVPELQTALEAAARERLEALVTMDDRALLRARPVVMTSVAPAQAIVEYANTNAIDLIVMGTHGRTALAHMLMGSVAERVVRTAPCPVLTVRHPEREFIVADAIPVLAKRDMRLQH